VRDYIHVMDLAAGHVLALGALADDAPIWAGVPADAPRFRAYNLGKGRGSSVLQIVEAMRAATGFGYKTSVVGRRCVPPALVPSDVARADDMNDRRGDVPDLTADPALAEKELGFRAPRELPEMCRDLWNWQSKNPEGYDTPARADAAAVL
jgi:UDP-glucose 4-epimerase